MTAVSFTDRFTAVNPKSSLQPGGIPVQTTYDYVVVGAGSAGCIIANRISATGASVLVLEAGDSDRHFWARLPVGYFKMIYNPRFSRIFDTEPSAGTAGRNVQWPRGRIIGGSSTINGLIYIRGQHADFDDWKSLGATGWSFKDCLPYFKSLETNAAGASELRGDTGPMGADDLRMHHPACDAWLQAAQQWGLPFNPDFNGQEAYGAGRYQLSIKGHWRCSSARAFLVPAMRHHNVTVASGSLVEKVVITGGRATGVIYSQRGIRHQVSAAKVVLCAGALQSPQLLQLSGVGPAAVLKAAGVDVVVDSPQVGENLQDHYQMRYLLRMKNGLSLNKASRNPLSLLGMGLQWLLTARGPLTVGAGQVGAAIRTPHTEGDRPDVQLLVMPLSVDKPGERLHDYPGFTGAIWQCHPHSRGTLAITSADPTRQPRIQPNYLQAEHDRKVIVEGVKAMREICAQAPFKGLWSEEVHPGVDVRSDEQILQSVAGSAVTVFHPVGTCRMGSDHAAVVDPELRVRGVDDLYVVDASVMPKITSANTNAPTLMIGEKGAAHILSHR